MKDYLSGGKLPSEDLGKNASWWWIMILSLNSNAMMKGFHAIKVIRNGPWAR
jgi:hypothetical protein